MWTFAILDKGFTVAILSCGEIIYRAFASQREIEKVAATVAWVNDVYQRAYANTPALMAA